MQQDTSVIASTVRQDNGVIAADRRKITADLAAEAAKLRADRKITTVPAVVPTIGPDDPTGGSGGTGGTSGGSSDGGSGGDSGGSSGQVPVVAPVTTPDTPLPDAPYNGPAAIAIYPPGIAPFAPPVQSGVTITAGAPQIDEFTRTAGPGESLVLTVENLSVGDVAFFVCGQNATSTSQVVQAQIQSIDGQAVTLTLPASLPANSVYLLWAQNAVGISQPVVVNQPQSWWTAAETATPGGTLSVLGRNLAFNGQTWAYLKSDTDGTGYWITAQAGAYGQAPDVNPYKVDISLPSYMSPGQYTVWINNGEGGQYGWSNSQTVTIAASTAPIQVTEASLLPAGSNLNNEANVQLAMNAAWALSQANAVNGQWAPVDLILAPGVITIAPVGSQPALPLVINGDVRLFGAGQNSDGSFQTVIQGQSGDNLDYLVTTNGQVNAGVENLAINVDGALASAVGTAAIGLSGNSDIIDNVNVNGFRDASDPGWYAIETQGGCINAQILSSTFTGAGLVINGSQNVIIDGCTFYGAGQNFGGQMNFSDVTQVSVTRTTVQDYSSTPTADEMAVRFSLFEQSASDLYVGDSQTIDLHLPSVYFNGGEQVAFESGDSKYVTHAVALSDSADTLTIPSTANLGAGMSVAITTGPGLGQSRIIEQVLSSTTLLLSAPWSVDPEIGGATPSTLSFGAVPQNVVVYQNSLSGDPSDEGNNSGFETWSGSYSTIVDDNTITDVRTGILPSTNCNFGGDANPTYFNLYTDNTISDVKFGILAQLGDQGDADTEVKYMGNVFRDNTISDVRAWVDNDPADLPSAIRISAGVDTVTDQFTSNVFEENATDSNIAVTIEPGGAGPAAAQAAVHDILFSDNTFTSDGSAASIGLDNLVTETDSALWQTNQWLGFDAQAAQAV